jgi:hypothetical protein
MGSFKIQARSRKKTPALLLPICLFLLSGCNWHRAGVRPSIAITQIPHASAGGPDQVEYIGGKVTGSQPGQKIVLYAHSGVWWVQPTTAEPLTDIQPDSTWKNTTHLGTEYTAMLVDAKYQPAARVNPLPAIGNGILAMTTVPGTPGKAVVVKSIQFSGYDWAVRTTSSNRGGEDSVYDPANAWTDDHGYLHLYMGPRNGRWTSAEVNLNRSLGFGTYRFVVQDISHLPASAVVGLFTWDDLRSQDFRNEIDVELSRWDNPTSWNAQYVVQPFYVAENVSRFPAPPGVLTYSFRWEPGTVSFRTDRGSLNSSANPVSHHTFTSGVPNPSSETVHIDLYDFHHSRRTNAEPTEVVIEKFEYAP